MQTRQASAIRCNEFVLINDKDLCTRCDACHPQVQQHRGTQQLQAIGNKAVDSKFKVSKESSAGNCQCIRCPIGNPHTSLISWRQLLIHAMEFTVIRIYHTAESLHYSRTQHNNNNNNNSIIIIIPIILAFSIFLKSLGNISTEGIKKN